MQNFSIVKVISKFYQKPAHFLSAQMAVLSSFLPMCIILGIKVKIGNDIGLGPARAVVYVHAVIFLYFNLNQKAMALNNVGHI